MNAATQDYEGFAGLLRIDHSVATETLSISSSLRCHPGRVRRDNQDRVAFYSVPLGELFVLADGVGGHGGGGKAATIAVEQYGHFLLQAPPDSDPVRALQEATKAVSRSIAQARPAGLPDEQNMMTTVVLILIHRCTACVGHIGDSRAYLARQGSMSPLTRDHSLVRQMVDHGLIAERDAQAHPNAHVLTRSLGTQDALLEITTYDLEHDDLLILCSDGLWGSVPDEELGRQIASSDPNIGDAADALLSFALAAGGPDNISLALVTIKRGKQASAEIIAPSAKRCAPGSPVLYATVVGILLLIIATVVLLIR